MSLRRVWTQPLVAAMFSAMVAVAALPAQTTSNFFDPSELQEIRLYLHPSDWQSLHDNYLENTYYECEFLWRDILVEGVGVRSRGLGSRSQDKPGLKVDFDRFDDAQTFLGLKSVVLDNLTQDASLLKERLSMAMFRRMGMAASRETHARLYVNDKYAGLYLLVESVDKKFLQRHLGEDTGYLYEYKWTEDYRFQYRGEDPEMYSPAPFKPQTNEKKPEPAPIEAFIRTMNQASDPEFASAIKPFLDMKLFLKHLAVEQYLAEWDGLLGDFGLNNFYIYRFKGNTRFQFFPWDKDVTFHAIDRSIFFNANDTVLVRRALQVPEFKQYFLEMVLECDERAGGPGGWLEQQINTMYDQVRQAALDDTKKPLSNQSFEETVEYLRSFARLRGDFVRGEVALAQAQ